ncbi:MAG TPA: hypothetical protein VK645_04810 [Chitinophagaceae bacterium]|nr:hypothetical protein [Chitinophagaceae bacterium]
MQKKTIKAGMWISRPMCFNSDDEDIQYDKSEKALRLYEVLLF